MSKKLFPCPVCGRAVSSVLFHANKNKAHQDFIAQQKQLILRLFEDLSFNSFIDLQDRGVYVSYKQCFITFEILLNSDTFLLVQQIV